MTDQLLDTGLESIEFQNDDTLDKVEAWVRKARQTYGLLGYGDKAFEKQDAVAQELTDIIRKRFNLNVVANVYHMEHDEWDCFILIPNANVNSATLAQRADANFVRSIANTKEFMNLYESLSKKSPGYLDRRKAVAHGFFAEVRLDMFVSAGLIKNSELTTHEVAAAILHEIGHAWDCMAMMGQSYTCVQGMAEFHRALTNITDPSERKIMLEYLNKKDSKLLADYDLDKVVALEPGAITTLVITERVARMRSQTGVKDAEVKSSETSADVFAARMGAAQHLASFVAKIGKNFNSTRSVSKGRHYFIETTKLMLAATPIIGQVVYVALLITGASHDDLGGYDETSKRVERQKQQVLIQLKDRNITRVLRDDLLSQLRTIEKLQTEFRDNHTVLSVLSRTLMPHVRNRLRKQEFMYHLERMSSNKLYGAAAKIGALQS